MAGKIVAAALRERAIKAEKQEKAKPATSENDLGFGKVEYYKRYVV